MREVDPARKENPSEVNIEKEISNLMPRKPY